ncbi:hypothetical protein DM02DRAFT_683577 [Periconia macrospinosa]|uniref:Uncharacterized protein n=1 Tax=Periconia macrospinosa TaxID=97972 RepID=A0A2V1DL28_9PLEO|nr:hypothetical protein DM02DRAFT_683577 [Periconia macrospinosa]
MMLPILWLSVFSVTCVRSALAAGGFRKMPDAHPLDDSGSFSSLEYIDPSHGKLAIELSTPYWEGKSWTYNIPATDDTEADEFTVFIIDTDVSSQEPNSAFNITIENRADNHGQLDPRQVAWACAWLVGCFDRVNKAFKVTGNQAIAIKNAARQRLTANNNQLLNRIVDGVLVNFAVGITTEIVSWYITNRIQGQSNDATDSCQLDAALARLERIEANLENLIKEINKGDSRPRVYDHHAEEMYSGKDGQVMRHSVVATENPKVHKALDC